MVFSAQAFTMMLASPVWGALADRYGRKLMVERATFGGTVILLLMAFVRSGEELVLLRAIQGLITGTVAANNALVASLVPRDRMGFAMGTLQVGQGAGVALGPVIGGLIADLYGYNYAFYVTAAMLFLAGILVYFGVEEKFMVDEAHKKQRKSFVSRWGHVITGSRGPGDLRSPFPDPARANDDHPDRAPVCQAAAFGWRSGEYFYGACDRRFCSRHDHQLIFPGVSRRSGRSPPGIHYLFCLRLHYIFLKLR
jgi:MFS family permease